MNKSPQGLAGLTGLTTIKQLASVGIKSCIARHAVFPHTLLFGVGGTGKTSIARAIGQELGYYFVEVEGAAFRKRDEIIECLTRNSLLAKKSHQPLLLFIDEVHRLHIKLQEALYIPMKEWRSTSTEGDISFPPFTLIAATTRRDMLDERSFVERFPNKWEVTRYHSCHIKGIVAALFRKWNMACDSEMSRLIATRCLGIPRVAANLSSKVRDVTLAGGRTEVNIADLRQAFDLEGLDRIGLTRLHHRYLSVLNEAVATRGVASIAAQLNQPVQLIEQGIEPILCELGLVEHGPRGRVITRRGREYLALPAVAQPKGLRPTGHRG